MKQSLSSHTRSAMAMKSHERHVSIVFSLVVQTLLCLIIAFIAYIFIVNIQFKQVIETQAEALGNSLVDQSAGRAVELLTIDDKLGLNIMLGDLAHNPLVANVAIFDMQGKELYRAGLKRIFHGEDLGTYCKALQVQQKENGKLCLSIDMRKFKDPWIVSIERTIILAVCLLLFGLYFSFRLGRRVITPIIQLRDWVRNPTMPAPCVNRVDELGDLAYELQSKLISQEDMDAYYAQFIESEPELSDESNQENETLSSVDTINEIDSASIQTQSTTHDNFLENLYALDKKSKQDHNSILAMNESLDKIPIINDMVPETILPEIQTAVLFIQLGDQNQLQRLPKERLMKLLQRYRDFLNQTVHLYRGELHTLSDGSSLVLFHGRGSEAESYVLHAICCGELMRALSYELQIELVETNTVLLLQMALAKGVDLLGLTLSELGENQAVQAAKLLANHSRNLLLLDQSIVLDTYIEKLARIRALANPSEAYCIERVLEPYAELLEKQLRNMRNDSV